MKRLSITLLALALVALIVFWKRPTSSTLRQLNPAEVGEEDLSAAGNREGNRDAPFAGEDRSGRIRVPLNPKPELRRQAPPEDAVAALERRLEERKDGEHVLELLRQLDSAATEDRAEALSSLGFVESRPEIVAACLQALQDPVDEVRMEAIFALTSLDSSSAVKVLSELSRTDPAPEIREAAARAVRHLAPTR